MTKPVSCSYTLIQRLLLPICTEMWRHLDLSLGEEDISNAGKINFLPNFLVSDYLAEK